MIIHEMEIEPQNFNDIASNKKKFELTFNAMEFKEGDFIKFIEYNKSTKKYTGRFFFRRVTHVYYDLPGLSYSKYLIISLEKVLDLTTL